MMMNTNKEKKGISKGQRAKESNANFTISQQQSDDIPCSKKTMMIIAQRSKSSGDAHIVRGEGVARDLSKKEEVQFKKTRLLHLHNIMKKPMDKEIAREAIKNYKEDKQQTTIRNTIVKANAGHLSKNLKLTKRSQDGMTFKEYL